MQDFLMLRDHSPQQIAGLLELSHTIKQRPGQWSNALQGKSIALLFEKPSLRTRASFAAGINRLGGHSIFLDAANLMGVREPARDVGANLALWHEAIVARVFEQNTLIELAAASDKPVINALSDRCHPCQAMADLLTLQERLGDLSKVHLTWLGDGNNVCHALMAGAGLSGMHFQVVTPEGYAPDADLLAEAQGFAKASGGSITVEHHLSQLQATDAIYTDTWLSMGQQRDADQVLRDFAPYQVNSDLMARLQARYFMHCLPAYRGREVTAEVVDGPQSLILQQAENRMHAQNAILVSLLNGVGA
ncbi:ornithine carbamoyltransferase [Pseudidiomarina salinarum]|uniref:Ornithine carbamoyltransferase n=1 Tax=Pseudidiomarina salinarum TaxID=435908 RepID=A0A094ISM4_9GAMM|nr:ornithine carbamoyltransferase [Pseudidiomarina salinarum]KFZ30690.1 ornithine carbamoyltransferase [Pseudidiomarina salinarum]RUO69210.1 ornithine carbamoyltransferase [Pseudidiomarina salinarum]